MTHDTPIAMPLYEAIVDVDAPTDLGTGPLGQRRIINITGGEFVGPQLRGRVLSGGADRQLVRPDGVRLLDALYEVETDDGTVLTVHNRVKVIESPGQERVALSHVGITAPVGPYGWLNDAVLVGRAYPRLADRQAVRICVYQLR